MTLCPNSVGSSLDVDTTTVLVLNDHITTANSFIIKKMISIGTHSFITVCTFSCASLGRHLYSTVILKEINKN